MLFTSVGRGLGFDFIDDFLDDRFTAAPSAKSAPTVMRTDIRDDGTNYILDMEVPGYKKEDLKIELKDGNLTVTASPDEKADGREAGGKLIHRERYRGSCKRSFYIGEDLRQDDIRASFENGVLSLRFPKEAPKPVEEAPRYIQIDG